MLDKADRLVANPMPLLCLATIYAHASVLEVCKDACVLIAVWLPVYAVYVLLVAVHEVGHLVTGIACGFRVKEFRVSCIRWRDGLELDWRGANLLSGWVNMQLTRPDDRLRLRYLLFVAAGPLANLIFATLLYPAAVHQSTWGGIAKYLFVGSILLSVVNLIPMKVRRLTSDGLQLVKVLFGRKVLDVLRFCIRCQEAAPALQTMRDNCDWKGLKDLTEELLALSVGLHDERDVVKRLKTILLFANGRLAETPIAGK